MNQYILLESGKVLLIQTVGIFPQAEYYSPLEKSKMDVFDKAFEKLYSTLNFMPKWWIQWRRGPDYGIQHANEDSYDWGGKDSISSESLRLPEVD